ncbi:FecCD family ABC transporter permease [Actinosynnema mirum]|uniref:Transport system permease protein n=1 Tax=Actinosynnema mirum (strain ATCC 29888 / DSM 43827 / JCM 3225 / NBRC 14064 / NCIMB 13271 / NRRL B-12336 / IMRU 3971 / 101) TaxID=446462 RepID=C6WGI5_ACTMD|nr:transport system permease protein [Actinosynnema mirum DSM 43827]AXX27676.1 ABC-type Fe3+-siderophore transport system, permease 2 component [Actinosynnema pretiosum subsp. pretiosum]
MSGDGGAAGEGTAAHGATATGATAVGLASGVPVGGDALARPTVKGRTGVRLGPLSWPLRWRPIALVLGGLALAATVLAVAIAYGDFPISLGQVVDVLLGGGSRSQRFVVMELRLPRVLTGLLVGAALAASGAIFQAISRNPLATPDIIGVTWGAGTGAVLVIVLAGSSGAAAGAVAQVGVPLAALAGGLIAGLVVYGIAWRRGIEGFRLVLVGVGVTAITANATQYLLTKADVNDTARAMVWIAGSLNNRGWEHIVPVALALVVLLPASVLATRTLGALQFGDDTTRGLGVRLNGARTALLLLGVVLAAVATAAAGPVGFVALAAPQIAVRLAGTATPPLFGSAVVGAVLVVLSDLIARQLIDGTELPVGVVTAVLGAPYLMHLLIRSRREART